MMLQSIFAPWDIVKRALSSCTRDVVGTTSKNSTALPQVPSTPINDFDLLFFSNRDLLLMINLLPRVIQAIVSENHKASNKHSRAFFRSSVVCSIQHQTVEKSMTLC